MCQRERHVDTPSTPCWAPCGGSLTRVGSHVGWDSSGGTLDAHLQAECAVPSGITQHSGLTYHPSRLTPGSDDCSTYLAASCKPHASMRSTLCEYQECRDVGTFSTRCEQTQYPIWVPMPVLRKTHAATALCMRASKVPHAGTRSTA